MDKFQESSDPSATRFLIRDLLRHSEAADIDGREEFFSLRVNSELFDTPSDTTSPPGSKGKPHKRYSERERSLLENAGVLVCNPVNVDEIKLADFF